MLELAPFRFPPAKSSSEIKFGFRYVVWPFPTVTEEGAVVASKDGKDKIGVVGIDTAGIAISLLAASMAACTFVTLLLIE